ncbi:MAG TPA: ABC transporter permease [Candidatus Saccharibacteria bacterium]|jgi:ABC-2 type transport system permease protein|nr:ABC transporter permease [Candidatus Saccharibacteria bacterium]
MNSKIQRISAKYRYASILLKQLVITDFKLRYQNSVLGYLWTLLRPLALFLTLYIIFGRFLKVGSDIPHYSVYLLLGIVFWNYFVEVTSGGVNAIVGRGDILRKLSFPRYVVVLSGTASAIINFSINMLIVVFLMVINQVPFRVNALLAMVPMLEMFLLALSLSFLLSALYVRFRDIGYIWEVFLQIAFYATPILYPLSLVTGHSEKIAKLMLLNPMAQIIQDARSFVVTAETQTITTLYGVWWARLIPLAIVLFITVVSWKYFKSRAPYFAEEI